MKAAAGAQGSQQGAPSAAFRVKVETLRAQSLTQADELLRAVGALTGMSPLALQHLGANVQSARDALVRGDLELASQLLTPLLGQANSESNHPRVHEGLWKLLTTVGVLSTLEKTLILPTPLGGALPEEFLARLATDPRELVDLLLTDMGDNVPAEERLLLMFQRVARNLELWRGGYHLTEAISRESGETLGALRDLLDGWAVVVGSVRQEGLRGELLRLLRWRLERCEDVMALREHWSLGGSAYRGETLRETLRLLTALAEALELEERAPVSLALWDEVTELMFHLRVRVDKEAWLRGGGRKLTEALEALTAQAPTLAASLVALERGGVGVLPPAARRPFLDRALLEHMEEPLRALWAAPERA